MQILRALLGLAFFCGIAWLLSSDRRRIDLRVVIGGILTQVVLALLILKWGTGRALLDGFSVLVTRFLGFGEAGARMVFGPLTGFWFEPAEPPGEIVWSMSPPIHLAGGGRIDILFAFKALPTIIYFSAVMGILYYLGVMQFLIGLLARSMSFLLRVSGAESLAMAANIFVGQTEAPLVVRPYIPGMTRSELMALMTGGFATIAGSVLAVYIGVLGAEYAGHLLAASFMSAPAAFVMAKMLVPETELSATAGTVRVHTEKTAVNVLDAAAEGTGAGLKLYLNVLAMLIAFVAMVALLNGILGVITVAEAPLSLERIFGWIFAPVAFAMGVGWEDCQGFGTLLGTKVAVNEFVAYTQLAEAAAARELSPRSLHMAAYALCGFANFASVGIQIGGISPLAPERRGDLSRLALRAMLGGACASWMTATIAGMFL